jgi:hypothetical protein
VAQSIFSLCQIGSIPYHLIVDECFLQDVTLTPTILLNMNELITIPCVILLQYIIFVLHIRALLQHSTFSDFGSLKQYPQFDTLLNLVIRSLQL